MKSMALEFRFTDVFSVGIGISIPTLNKYSGTDRVLVNLRSPCSYIDIAFLYQPRPYRSRLPDFRCSQTSQSIFGSNRLFALPCHGIGRRLRFQPSLCLIASMRFPTMKTSPSNERNGMSVRLHDPGIGSRLQFVLLGYRCCSRHSLTRKTNPSSDNSNKL